MIAIFLGTALAGTFTVAPTNLTLGEQHHSAVLVLNNTGTDVIRFEATSFRWDESDAGEMLLEPADELLVFPTIFSLAPGESRQVRVGTAQPPGPHERTWRVFIEELPSLSAQGNVGVEVRTRMGIPIFLPPETAQAAGRVSGALADGQIALQVVNEGNTHFRVADVRAVGRDASGAERFAHAVRGWYVLAGGTRSFTFDLPADVCADLVSLELTADTTQGRWMAPVAVDPARCGP